MGPKILIDWDDTIANLCTAWISELNKRHNLNASEKDMCGWDLSNLYPELSKEEIIEPLTEENFWKTITIKQDALDIIPILIEEGYDIYICTATDYRNIQKKVDNLILKYFPCINIHNIICCYNKQMIRGDILIDDYIKNLVHGTYVGLLFSAPHNKVIDATWPYTNIYRVNNWLECYNLIHELFPVERKLL